MMVKNIGRKALRSAVMRLPWGAREAIFDGLLHRMGPYEVFARAIPHLGYTGLLADGEFGLMQSATNDRVGLDLYGRMGTFGRRSTTFFEQFFSGGDGTYLDIGANIGLTIIPIARGNPKVRCVGFEPEPVNFSNLTANVKRNVTHGNVELHQTAIFDSVSTLPFGLSFQGNVGDHRVVVNREPGRRQIIEVPAAPLDALIGPIDMKLGVKIDVQGSEPFVISGGQKTLARAGALAIEFCPAMIEQVGGSVDTVLDFLAGFERLALLPGESDGALVFGPSEDGCARLRAFCGQVGHDEREYINVYARRQVQPIAADFKRSPETKKGAGIMAD
jgi:FkbM family methyltransferase